MFREAKCIQLNMLQYKTPITDLGGPQIMPIRRIMILPINTHKKARLWKKCWNSIN